MSRIKTSAPRAPDLAEDRGRGRNGVIPTAPIVVAFIVTLLAGGLSMAKGKYEADPNQDEPRLLDDYYDEERPEAPDPDLDTERMRRAGPFYLKPGIRLKDVGYDDNIRYLADERTRDYTATAEASVDALLLRRGRGGFRFEQSLDYVTFRSESDLDHLNSSTRARGILLLRPAVLSAEGRYLSVRERPNTEIDARVRREERISTISARTRREGRLGGSAQVAQHSFRYGVGLSEFERVADRLDRDELGGTLAGELRILPKTRLTLEATRNRVDFQESSRRGRSVAVLAGVAFEPTAAVQGYLKVGKDSLRFREDDFEPYRGWVADAQLRGRIGSRSDLRLDLTRENSFSALDESIIFVHTDWTAIYEHFVSRRTSIAGRYGRGQSEYPDQAASGVSSSFQRVDHTLTWGVSVKYFLSRRAAVIVNALRTSRDSNDDSWDRTRNLYTIGSTFEF